MIKPLKEANKKMKIKNTKTLVAIVLASSVAVSCGGQNDISPAVNPVYDNHSSNCELMKRPKDESNNYSHENAAKFSYFPSAKLFDQNGLLWGSVVPVNEEIAFNDRTKFMADIEDGDYIWMIDADPDLSTHGSLILSETGKPSVPDKYAIFKDEGWHSAGLSIMQISYPNESIHIFDTSQISYFNVVSRSLIDNDLNWHPVPIIEPNYSYYKPFEDGYFGESAKIEGTDLDIGKKNLINIIVDKPVFLDFTRSYDIENFGAGRDCNGVAEYSVCINKVGEDCEAPIVSSSGNFEVTFNEAGKYRLGLKVTDQDGLSTSKSSTFEVK